MGLSGSASGISFSASTDAAELERLFFRHSKDGMLLVRVIRDEDGCEHFILQAENPAARERLSTLGQTGDFRGRDMEAVFPAWLHKHALIHYRACVASGDVRRYEIQQPNGGMTHESIATPIMGTDGKTVDYIIVVMRDIAERINHERQLNIALAKAEEANRSKSEFFASMSHELRTPLNAILGFSEMMEKGVGGTLTERHRQYVDHIHNSGQHLLRIISDILDLSKMEAGQFKLQEAEVSLPPLAETCMHMVQDRARRKNLKTAIKTEANLPAVTADAVRIKQILLNLLSNAIKFTDQGSVTLAIRFDPQEGFLLSVTDTGIGMSASELKTALEPFGQVEDAYCRNNDGTGLGLTIVQHLAQLHGGRLELTSKKGAGTCATAILPPGRVVNAAQAKAAG